MQNEVPIQIDGARAFAILSEAYAEQTVELRIVRAQVEALKAKVQELTPKPKAKAEKKAPA